MKNILKALLLLTLFFLLTSNVFAQTREGEFQASVGAGAGLNPPMRFDLDLAGEYFWQDQISFGLDFDVFIRGRAFYNFIPFARYHFDLAKWPSFTPYVGGGMGGLVSSRGQGWFDLMLPELGFMYELSPHLFIGPNTSFHILAGSSTTWDLQLLGQVAYRF